VTSPYAILSATCARVVVASVLFLGALAQVPEATALDKCGYIDKSGKMVVSPKYKIGEDFQGRYAAVVEFSQKDPFELREEKQWTIIDNKGNPHYSTVDFWLHAAGTGNLFKKNEGSFYDVTTGRELKAGVKHCTKFGEGFAVAESISGRCQTIDTSGKVLGLLARNLVLGEAASISAPCNGLHPVKDSKSGRWGYANRQGKLVIPAKYKWAQPFSEGLASVSNGQFFAQSYPTGYINTSGKLVIGMKFETANEFKEGLASVEDKKGHRFFINKQGKVAIALGHQTTYAGDFCEGLAAVSEYSRHIPENKYDILGRHIWGFIDKTGKVVIAPQFKWKGFGLAPQFSEGLCAVSTDARKGCYFFGFINRAGKFVIPPKFKSANNFAHGRASVVIGSYDFSPEEWKLAGKSDFGRADLLENFVLDHELIGLDSQQVKEFFGAPDTRNGNLLVYRILTGCSYFGTNSLELELRNNRIAQYRISGRHAMNEWITTAGQFPSTRY
jgi:hypothetical protein